MTKTKYIVSESQILNAVRSSLENHITNPTIIRELMVSIENNVETVLEDDCDEFTDDMWDAFMC